MYVTKHSQNLKSCGVCKSGARVGGGKGGGKNEKKRSTPPPPGGADSCWFGHRRAGWMGSMIWVIGVRVRGCLCGFGGGGVCLETLLCSALTLYEGPTPTVKKNPTALINLFYV